MADEDTNLQHSSISQQIIQEFLDDLKRNEGYESIASELQNVILQSKLSEVEIRKAMFGEEPL
ncbi:hypothetical protein [Methylophilus sp. 5]|uniref:hypothetical protein n=1 Tax=Methylophilus sp. 5 TaxID=1112274 RepID=UPI00048F92B2|nr:hypothetical protein [Methylophilus sp. 5]